MSFFSKYLKGLALGSFFFSLVFPLFALEQKDSQFYLDKANLYIKEGRSEMAIQYLQEAVEKDPYNAEARNNLGEIYAKKNMLDDALNQFDKALELRPHYIQALSNESYVYLQKKIFPNPFFTRRRRFSWILVLVRLITTWESAPSK